MTSQPNQIDTLPSVTQSFTPSTRRGQLAEWLDRQPLVPPAAGLVAGIWLDSAWAVPLWTGLILFLFAGILLLAAAARRWILHVVLAMASLGAGVILYDLHFRQQPANHVARYCDRGELRVRLTGTMLAPPDIRPVSTGRVRWTSELPRTRLLVEAEEIQGKSGPLPVCGTVAVHVRQPVLHVAAGDRIELLGTLYRPPPPDNPGQQDWRLILRRKGILAEMSCERAVDVEVRGVAAGWSRWAASLRRRFRTAMLDRAMPADVPGADLLSALVLGQRSAVDDALNQAFVNTGTVHYLSVSGAHVGMLASLVWLSGFLAGVPRRTCAFWAMIVITAYALLTEPRPPVIRAAFMGDMLCISVLLGRPARSANWLALSALILLVAQPMQLFEPGFQLSFITVLAVMFLAPRLHDSVATLIRRLRGRDDPLLSRSIQERLNPPTPARVICNWIIALLGWAFSISVAAWLVGSILGVYHFHQVALWGWLNSVLIMPLMWLVLVVGLIKTPVSTILPHASGVLGKSLDLLTDCLMSMVEHLQHLPGSGAPVPSIPLWLTIAALAVIGAWTVRPWLRISRWWLTGAALAVAVSGLWQLSPPRHRDALTLTFPSITSGSACVINFPNGCTWIYDVGSLAGYDIQKWVMGPVLAEQRVSHIDNVILSHANLDHFSGVPGLITANSVGHVLVSPWFSDFSTPGDHTRRLLANLERNDISLKEICAGTHLSGTADVLVEILWPPAAGAVVIREANESSIVLRLTYCGYRILLCGDIMAQAQGRLLDTCDLKADILVLPHHGSTTCDPRPFIRAVDPHYCIRCGGRRAIDLPNRLADVLVDRVYLDTQRDGAVLVNVRKSGVAVRAFKGTSQFD